MADREEAPQGASARSFVRARGAPPCPTREFPCGEVFELAQAGSDWIWETDAELRFSWLSEDYEEATGVPAETMLGRFRFDFLRQGPSGSAQAEAHLDDLQSRRPFRDFVYEFTAGRRDCRWVSITGFPRFSADGRFLGYRGVGRNVTGLIAPFEAALERSRLAESVLDSVRDPIFVKDEDLNFVFVNEAFASLYGRSPQAMLGRDGGDFLPADQLAAFERSERQVLSSGEPYEVEEQFEQGGAERSRIVRKHRVEFGSGRRYVACFVFDATDMKRRETEAEVARRRLADVLESLPAGVVIYDRDDKFVLANRKLQDSLPGLQPIWRTGLSFRDAVLHGRKHGYFRSSGDPAVDILYETDPDAWTEAYMARHQLRHSMYERRNPDGRWFQVIDTRTDDGTFIGVRVDITEMKEREKALRRSMRKTELYRHVLDELPVPAYVKSEDLTFEFVNKAWSDLTGISKEEASGQTDRDFFAGEGDGFAERDLSVIGTGIANEVEETLTRRDGTQRQLIAKKSRLVASDGTVHLIGSSTDITEVKAREARLQESQRENEIFRSLIDNVPVAIYAKRNDLKLFYVNKYWTQLTGVPYHEAIGRTDFEVSGDDGLAFMEDDRAILRTGDRREIEETLTAPDGGVRYQMARKGSMVASDGTLYLLGSTIDVTEQKEREKELREAQRRAVLADRAKSEFLANMSHEIRTPMNGVLGMAELLARSDLDPKQKTFTEIIVKSGNALLTIINDILDFSKIDAGQLVLDPAPFALAEAIEDVATLISTRAKEKDLELIVRVEPGLNESYVGDVGRFRQIITNLIGNAVKFTDSGHVLVDASGERLDGATRIRIAVTDTGIGIPSDKLAAVFEKFSQVDASSTRRHEGTGLGLAITSRLVSLMGGEIGVESAEGEGSTFWFTVTLPNAGRSRRRVTPSDVTGARILIVDDNQVNRSILSEQMASWAFDSCAAESGEEGLKVLAAAAAQGIAVDCIVLDYQMPGMTGGEMARIVRATPGIADTPIVMLTSVDQSLSGPGFRNLAIEAQLIKPARSSLLLETIVAAIQKQRAPAEDMAVDRTEPVAPAGPSGSEPPPAQARKAGKLAGDGHGVDILVAEDNEVNQLVFTQILGETDYSFEIVSNGRLALAALDEVNPRIILMDVSMPEMSGLEATAAIRNAEAGSGRHIPIIGVTAHALKGDRERCIEAGMDDYLPKPISPKALIEKVERWTAQAGAANRHAG
ncbi:PAS domain-containing protein [Mesorhizobium sp. YM1C-6-2]|uniref:PAS domain-containing protein n=1 Tax=Mesorhizobium sp. YM1C-6-2 TaxID=1827501 RepID=UPI000EF250AC|nr:PAS domain-containing protein [Mesorhizobium sp. YM1C-6-2]RLP22482.1 PAS domain S-box protein [Mesorhizobium sp. YM1C-6-2]